MKKIREVVFNATIYRSTSVALQLTMVELVFGLSTNWQVVLACNLLCFLWYITYHLASIRIRRYSKRRIQKPTIKVYLSHPIRGSKVDDATKIEQITNSDRARLAARELHKIFPELDIYCPGDAEKFVHLTYALKWLTDEQILDIDCRILRDCNCVFAYAFDISRGMNIEIDDANSHDIPILEFKSLDAVTIKRIRAFIDWLTRTRDQGQH